MNKFLIHHIKPLVMMSYIRKSRYSAEEFHNEWNTNASSELAEKWGIDDYDMGYDQLYLIDITDEDDYMEISL